MTAVIHLWNCEDKYQYFSHVKVVKSFWIVGGGGGGEQPENVLLFVFVKLIDQYLIPFISLVFMSGNTFKTMYTYSINFKSYYKNGFVYLKTPKPGNIGTAYGA